MHIAKINNISPMACVVKKKSLIITAIITDCKHPPPFNGNKNSLVLCKPPYLIQLVRMT